MSILSAFSRDKINIRARISELSPEVFEPPKPKDSKSPDRPNGAPFPPESEEFCGFERCGASLFFCGGSVEEVFWLSGTNALALLCISRTRLFASLISAAEKSAIKTNPLNTATYQTVLKCESPGPPFDATAPTNGAWVHLSNRRFSTMFYSFCQKLILLS